MGGRARGSIGGVLAEVCALRPLRPLQPQRAGCARAPAARLAPRPRPARPWPPACTLHPGRTRIQGGDALPAGQAVPLIIGCRPHQLLHCAHADLLRGRVSGQHTEVLRNGSRRGAGGGGQHAPFGRQPGQPRGACRQVQGRQRRQAHVRRTLPARAPSQRPQPSSPSDRKSFPKRLLGGTSAALMRRPPSSSRGSRRARGAGSAAMPPPPPLAPAPPGGGMACAKCQVSGTGRNEVRIVSHSPCTCGGGGAQAEVLAR